MENFLELWLALKVFLLNRGVKLQFYSMRLTQVYLDKPHKKMAEKMRDIAEYIQVICISHLPQVASMSDHHLLISKSSKDDRTTTQVQELIGDDKVDEIARMISGASVTDLTRENARENDTTQSKT